METIGKGLLALAVIVMTVLGSMVTALFSLEFSPLLPHTATVGKWKAVETVGTAGASVRDRIAQSNALFGAVAAPIAAVYHREVTETDAPLMRGCSYRVKGRAASSAWWVLEIHAKAARGRDPELVHAFYSRDIATDSGERFDFAVPKPASPRPRSAGNSRDPAFAVLRLYGLALRESAALRKEDLPTIVADPSCP